MARKKINVSAAIREYLGQHSDVGPTEAAKAISEKIGKKVTPIYVSNIKTLMSAKPKKKGRRGRKPGRKPGSAAVTTRAAHHNGSVQLVTIEAMKSIVRQVGASTAKQLIDLLV
jgi:hypothetical protein